MYCAYVTTIKELRKHNNADRLMCATIFGSNVIVDLSYTEGQKVIYFPVDGQLSEEFANDNNLIRNKGGYLDPKKRNITALKLRGEKSDGLVLPIEVLSKYTDVTKLTEGEQISILGGHEICKKYIPRSNRQNKGGSSNNKNKKSQIKKVIFPFFEQHVDTAQLMYNQSAFKEGDTCYITLKMHGTSGRTANTIKKTMSKAPEWLRKLFRLKDRESAKYDIVSGTRRVTLTNFDGGFYGNDEFRKKWHEFFASRLPKGFEVYYELVGWVNDTTTIMPRCKNKLVKDKEFSKKYGDETIFSYGCDVGENDCYVYRMTATNPDGKVIEIPWEQVEIECEKMGVKCVPTFEKFIFTTWEDLIERVEKYMDITDPIGKTHVAEGVVVRIDNKEKFTAFKNKGFSFKVVSGIIADSLTSEQASNMSEDILSEI